MSKTMHYFQSSRRLWLVALNFALDERIAQWQHLRAAMIRQIPAEFTRDEWAYLIAFLDPDHLLQPFTETFGERLPAPSDAPTVMARPRQNVAVWLPGNVSLLGPLVLIMTSFTGAAMRLKASATSDDLAEAFLRFARQNLPDCGLKTYLENSVQLEKFDRDDARNRAMADKADVRIVFGSDAAIAGVDALPHPIGSALIGFGDHVSQAWVGSGEMDLRTLSTLIKVFAIYGQAGCTSPQRVIMLDGSNADAANLRDAICAAWPKVIPTAPQMHVASANILARQLAAADGWDAVLSPNNAAVICSGDLHLPATPSLMTLAICPATFAQAIAALPENIQTIGYAEPLKFDADWYAALAQSRIRRIVPMAQMHHFRPTWDGIPFWRQMFEEVEMTQ